MMQAAGGLKRLAVGTLLLLSGAQGSGSFAQRSSYTPPLAPEGHETRGSCCQEQEDQR